MKKNLLIALAVCLASVAGAVAQPYNMIRVDLPYNIVVGKTTLPAGEFTITDSNDNGTSSVVIIRSVAGPAASILMERAKSVTPTNHPTVELKLVNGNYELQTVEFNGNEYQALR